MARFYRVRQRQSDKRFDMTVSSDDEGWCHPIGYCAGLKELVTDEDYQKAFPFAADNPAMLKSFRADHEKRLPFKDKYHKNGHATAEEAEACHQEYEFDQELRFSTSEREQHKCEVCDAWCQGQAHLGEFNRFYVCPEHANRQGVEQARAKYLAKFKDR